MDDKLKHRILSYLKQVYAKSLWPYHTLRTLQNMFGEDTNDALNKLFKEGYIRKREGINSPIVELIKFDD